MTREHVFDSELSGVGEDMPLLLAKSLQQHALGREGKTEEEWLRDFFAAEIPDLPEEERAAAAKDIVGAVNAYNAKSTALRLAEARGMSRDGWLAQEFEQVGRTMNAHEYGEYLHGIDEAIRSANRDLARTIMTKSGEVNQNPNLDGYIFEAEHAASFNMDAALKNDSSRAEVLRPEPGQRYAKHSADIAVHDSNGNVAKEYQAKCYADAERTNAAFNKGDYAGQEKLVPQGHERDGSTSSIEYKNVKSSPLSKEESQSLQQRAQKEGDVPGKSWSDYSNRSLAVQMGKQACLAGVQGAALGAAIHLTTRMMDDGEVDARELARTTLLSGAKSGSTCAVAGALKVYAEKMARGLPTTPPGDLVVRCVPPIGLPLSIPRNPVVVGMIASVAVDSVCTAYKVAQGELTVREGCLEMERSACSVVGGAMAYVEGAKAGAVIGGALGPLGVAFGAFAGGVLAGMAGSAVGRLVAKGVQAVREAAVATARTAWSKVKEVTSNVVDFVANIFS